jgi:hypothetical protein
LNQETRQLSKIISAVSLARIAEFVSFLPPVNPGVPLSTINAVALLFCLGSPGSCHYYCNVSADTVSNPVFGSVNDPMVSFSYSGTFHISCIASGVGFRKTPCTDMFGSS